jgi:hypothetical protein
MKMSEIFQWFESLLCRNGPRMNGFNICITSTVPVVKGQNPFDAMYSHRASRRSAAHRGLELQTGHARPAVFATRYGPLGCRGAIGAFLRRILPAGLFLEEKERSRCGREGGYTYSRIRPHSVTYRQKHVIAPKNGINCRDYERIIVVIRLDPPEKDVMLLSRRYSVLAI